MSLLELFLLAVGLSMDAFAVSVCKGLSVRRGSMKQALTVGIWFGGFQALMPFLGYLLGITFSSLITSIDHWIAFVLLALIGFNMIKESREEEEEEEEEKPVKKSTNEEGEEEEEKKPDKKGVEEEEEEEIPAKKNMKDEEEEEGGKSKIKFAPLAVFCTFFVAELGDKTQLTAITFGANEGMGAAFIVWIGCSLGLFLADILGMLVGYLLKSKTPDGLLNTLAFVIFAIFGIYTAYQALNLISESVCPITVWPLLAAVTVAFVVICVWLYMKKKKGQDVSADKG